MLTYLLLDKLRSSESGRIINVTAPAYQIGDVVLDDINFDKREYDMGAAYSQSKMALVLFTRHLAKVLEGIINYCHNHSNSCKVFSQMLAVHQPKSLRIYANCTKNKICLHICINFNIM